MTLLPKDPYPDEPPPSQSWAETTLARIIQEYNDMAKEIDRLQLMNAKLYSAMLRLADKYNYALEVQDPEIDDIEFWYTSDGSITGTPWDFAQEELNKLQEKP